MPVRESPESQEASKKNISQLIGSGSSLKKSQIRTQEIKTSNKRPVMTKNYDSLMELDSVCSETNKSQFTLEKARFEPNLSPELTLKTHDKSLEKLSQVSSQSIGSDENRSPSIQEDTLENDGQRSKINP